MKKTTITLLALSFLLAPLSAIAQDVSVNANVNANANVSAGGAGVGVSATASASATRITKAKSRADQEITRRIDNLTRTETRINNATHISADGKTSLTTTINAQISALQQLKTQIDAETSTTSLKSEIQSITTSYRVYALVMPQLAIIAAADRVADVADAMTTLAGKLGSRVTASSTASLTAALADMKAKVADAQTQATAAVNAVIALKPDNGDKTVMAENTATLKGAHSKLQAAQQDLVAARKDMRTIYQGLHISASANASADANMHTQSGPTTTTSGQ